MIDCYDNIESFTNPFHPFSSRSTFTLRLVEPMTGFQVIEKRGGGGTGKKKAYGSGKETIRFKADGTAAIETSEQDETTQTGIDAINILLDTFMGINDTELATQVQFN